MNWTRRHFLYLVGSGLALLGVGVGLGHALRGRAYFDDWRALPGMRLGLTLDIEGTPPESLEVDLMARDERGSEVITTIKGAQRLEIEVPCVQTCAESYELYAIVRNWRGCRCMSECVEVLSQPYQFGL